MKFKQEMRYFWKTGVYHLFWADFSHPSKTSPPKVNIRSSWFKVKARRNLNDENPEDSLQKLGVLPQTFIRLLVFNILMYVYFDVCCCYSWLGHLFERGLNLSGSFIRLNKEKLSDRTIFFTKIRFNLQIFFQHLVSDVGQLIHKVGQ